MGPAQLPAAVSTLVDPRHRGRAFGLFATLGPIGTVAGPAVGGALIEAWGWRATFLVHLPVALAVAWLAHRTVPGGGRLRLPSRGRLADAVGLGTVLVAAFVALDRAETVATADVDWFGIGAALALAVIAGWWWARRADSRPVLDALSRPALWPSLVALPLATATSGGLFFLTPYLLVTVVGSDSMLAGTALATLPLAMALCSPLAGWLADHISPRRVAAAGALVAALGALGLQTVDAQAGVAAVAWPLAVVGIGAGLFTGPNSSAILSATPDGMAATVGAVTQMGRTLGFALGPAVAALTWHIAGGGIAGFHLGAGAVLGLAALAAVFAAAVPAPSWPVEAASPAPTEQHPHETA
ncbi:MFS transporter [Haloechinothrix sp. YIM 98757]|uniref:MFS transporter n=1 Tax=Haloechinothrix aidingensis TaxID=2752311 RepID=A0A838ABI3_9PSEU|nr:MFS transporter [Haloechinothrix aidingensis]